MEKIFYNNKWLKSESKKKYETKSFNSKKNFTYPNCSDKDLENIVRSAEKFKKSSHKIDKKTLKKKLLKISKTIHKHRFFLAKKEILETGKNYDQAIGEVKYCATLWRYASNILKNLDGLKNLDNNHKGIIKYEPMGIVSLIVPWNFPLIVTSERLPFILAAGNAVIIKPSEYASQSLIHLVKILRKEGFPKGMINLIFGKGEKIGKNIVKNRKVNMISFTGSTKVGKKIMKLSSESIKRLSLELGGKNPIIIFEDANIFNAIKIVIKSFNEIVFQETGCRLCGCTSETGEKVGISKKRGERVAFVFMRNLCCGTPYTCVACPLCIRMVGFIISILSVFQILIMEMCN